MSILKKDENLTDSQKLDVVLKKVRGIEIRQTVQLVVVVLAAVGIMAIITERVKEVLHKK